jgi:hypothetical protein
MRCPACQLELGVERRADEVVLTYSFKVWEQHCHHRAAGDPVWCGHLLPTILKQLPNSTPFRSQTHAKDDRALSCPRRAHRR